ncbi:MAG: hypothetical protein LIO54_04640, partial [Oscillospiraceae bacterium]|nr:hypothetical protein [Oscillospiraceae bacterium]
FSFHDTTVLSVCQFGYGGNKVAGAFLFVEEGKAQIDILPAEGDTVPFDRESMLYHYCQVRHLF